MEWQPIDTAPKDADTILLTDGRRICTGTWEYGDRFNEARWFIDGQGDECRWANDYLLEPTHWMPLPSLPK